ncbi:MAG: MFS transporter [Actinomycetota bacterium]|nr:MFS transporter [Actinomycetota bacterium]
MRRLVADRDTRLLFAGQSLSTYGDLAMFLALGIWAKELTGSNAAAGLVFFAFLAPTVAAPLVGILVDRVRRRPLIIAVDCTIGVIVLSLLAVDDAGDIWLLYLVTVLYGTAALVINSAQPALLKVMVPDELLGEANAAFQTVRQGLRLVAPLTGAGLYAAVGGAAVAVADAATFGVAALSLGAMRTVEPAPARTEHRLVREVSAGLRHLWHALPLRRLTAACAAAFVVIGFAETAIFAVVDEGLGRPSSFVGVLLAVQGGGAIVGGLTAARVLRVLGDARLVGAAFAVLAGGLALLAAPAPAVVGGGMFVGGIGISWGIIGFATALQRRTPVNLQGRVHTAAELLVGTPQTFSIALGAVLSTVVDYRVLVAVMVFVIGSCGAFLVTSGSGEGVRRPGSSRAARLTRDSGQALERTPEPD